MKFDKYGVIVFCVVSAVCTGGAVAALHFGQPEACMAILAFGAGLLVPTPAMMRRAE